MDGGVLGADTGAVVKVLDVLYLTKGLLGAVLFTVCTGVLLGKFNSRNYSKRPVQEVYIYLKNSECPKTWPAVEAGYFHRYLFIVPG